MPLGLDARYKYSDPARLKAFSRRGSRFGSSIAAQCLGFHASLRPNSMIYRQVFHAYDAGSAHLSVGEHAPCPSGAWQQALCLLHALRCACSDCFTCVRVKPEAC